MSSRYMSIENALSTIQQKGVFLHFDADRKVDLWSPGKKMPITLRRAIVKHRDELVALMRSGDWRVCPSPRLHRKYLRCAVKCGVCARISADLVL